MVQNILKPMNTHSYGTPRTEALLIQANSVVSEPISNASTSISVAANSSSVVVLASTPGRQGASFYNGGTTTCYLTYGPTATTSNYATTIANGSSFSLPSPVYDGVISAIWSGSPSGNLQVTYF